MSVGLVWIGSNIFSPSNQWQDSVSSMLNKLLVTEKNESSITSSRRSDIRGESYPPKLTAGYSSDDNISLHGRRQRRRVGDDDYSFGQRSTSSTSGPRSAVPHKDSTRIFTSQEAYLSLSDIAGTSSPWRSLYSSVDGMTSGSEDELTGAVGQLSLNEDEQVRYHGKASGLYLLGNKERVDRRNEGGIWLVFSSFYACFHIISDFVSIGAFRKLAFGLHFPQVRRPWVVKMSLYHNYRRPKSKGTCWTCILPMFIRSSPSSINEHSSIHTRGMHHSFFADHGTKSHPFLKELVLVRLYLLIPTRRITNPPLTVGSDLCQPFSSSLCMLLLRAMMKARLQLI